MGLGDLVTEAAHRFPDRDAVVMDGVHLAYAELEAGANRFARSLLAHGVSSGDRVGLWTPKSPAAIVALYGTLKCGAAYVPVDPGAPVARLATIARDASLSALVVSPDRLASAGEALSGLESLRALWLTRAAAAGAAPAATPVPVVTAAEAAAESAAAPDRTPREEALAYVLYTSGSTGVPKGVMHTHASARAFSDWAAHTFELTHEDRVSNHAPFHFDLSTFDLYSSARAAAAVYPVPARAAMFPTAIANLYTTERLTVWYETPSGLALLLRHGKLGERDLSALRVLLFAGEVMPVPLLRELMTLAPRARFANLYGPTETNVCTFHEVQAPPDADQPLPIGVPCAGDRAVLLDESLRPVPDGEVGELWVHGPTLMRGYWGDAERTALTLRAIPSGNGEVLAYRTGDLVRQRPDGAFDFRGRRDHQVKTRGYRVELGEVESALGTHPEVAEVVVVPVPDPEVGNRLRALVVRRGAVDASAATLRDHCARTLPRYMVPEFVEFRDALPRTASGKVDRAVLAREAAERKDLT
jgi:amino acid adenylation domain-containing protein